MMTNRKTNKLERWLPTKKYVKLLNLRKTCPLTFNERLVFSLLVYASRRKRVAGLSQPIRSVLDYDAIRELAKVNGEQGRLAGLLKLWLRERVGQGAAQIEVQRLLTRVGEMQARLAEIAGRV